jgi:microcystin-dependent protein
MGQDILAGHTYDETEAGAEVNFTNLNAHVNNATLKETVISARTAKSPVALTDLLLISDGALKKATLQEVLSLMTTELLLKFVPPGAVQAFAMNSSPNGWLACDGAAVSRVTYEDLFTAISTLYGVGNGTTTFNVPDLRGYFVRGSGTNSDGTAAGTFGEKVADEFKAHTHLVGSGFGTSGAFGALAGNGSTESSSTGGAETRPKNIAMLYCIKY